MLASEILTLLFRFGPAAVDLAYRLKAIAASDKPEVTQADWDGLKTKYASKTAAQYLAEAGGAPLSPATP